MFASLHSVSPNTILFVRLVSGFFASEMLLTIPEVFPRSFSSGELGLFVQSVTALLSVSVACMFDSYVGLGYSFCRHMTSSKVLQVLSIGLTFFFVNCLLILKRFKTELTLLVYGAFCYAIAMSYFALLKILDREPLSWLLESTTRTSTRVSRNSASILTVQFIHLHFNSRLTDLSSEDVGNLIWYLCPLCIPVDKVLQ